MKKICVIIVMLLIIGVIVAQQVFKKDDAVIIDVNQMEETNTQNSTSTTPAVPVYNQPSATTSTSGTPPYYIEDWEGKYQIVEFGNLIPDSNPMAYDAYGYTDIEIVFMHDKGVEVTMSQRTGTGTPRPIYGTGRITPEGEFEILSPTGSVLVTLKQGDFGANTDTQITWGTLSPVLETTTNKFVHVRKGEL
jgi:hypothetical protein